MINIKPFFLILLPALFLPALGAAVGLSTQSGIDGWYQTIAQSPLTPPDHIFGIVWSILYVMMGISLGLIFVTPGAKPAKTRLLQLFFLQLALNLAWSFVFFQLHWLWVAAVWVAALIGLVVLLIVKLWPFRRGAALLLVPYVLWLCFALYLSTTIALLNR
ncbi:MAG: TspO/MBR family protein [Micavibrio sp.]